MEKHNPASDSEDEAFESADEGEVDDGPSPPKGSTASTMMDQHSVESGNELNKDPRDEKAESKNDEAELKVSDIVEKEKDVARGIDEDSLKSDDNVGDNIAGEGTEKEAGKSNSDHVQDVEEKVEKAEIVTDKADSTKSLPSGELGVATPEHKNTDNAEEPTEPSVDLIHELPKEENSEMPVSQAMDRQASGSEETKESEHPNTGSGGWGWGGWGSMLSKATSSVSSVLETVETQLGIPSPTEMARLATAKITEHTSSNEKEKEKDEETNKEIPGEKETSKPEEGAGTEKGLSSWLSGLGVSQISSIVQNTGKEIVSGSLDALEFVGKKTIDAISHGDPGFRRKRMTLSQALRDAKEKAQQKSTEAVEEETVTFSIEFDKFQGLAHLEALEMISHESEAELEKLLELSADESLKDKNEQIEMLKEKFKISENEDDDSEVEATGIDNFEEVVIEQVAFLSLSVTPTKIINVYEKSHAKSEKVDGETVSTDDLFSDTIICFAEMTARSVELFHKIGEFMLLPDVKALFLVKSRADALRTICITLRSAVSTLSNKFAATLNESAPEKDDKISKMITDIYLEASNSSAYINDSFHLLLPIFQLSVVKNS